MTMDLVLAKDMGLISTQTLSERLLGLDYEMEQMRMTAQRIGSAARRFASAVESSCWDNLPFPIPLAQVTFADDLAAIDKQIDDIIKELMIRPPRPPRPTRWDFVK